MTLIQFACQIFRAIPTCKKGPNEVPKSVDPVETSSTSKETKLEMSTHVEDDGEKLKAPRPSAWRTP